jgi:hypothetical protein
MDFRSVLIAHSNLSSIGKNPISFLKMPPQKMVRSARRRKDKDFLKIQPPILVAFQPIGFKYNLMYLSRPIF